MPKYDYQDYEDMEEVTTEKIKRSGSRKPKKSWSDQNKKKQKKAIEKRLQKKRKLSEKNVVIEDDD